MTPSRLLLSLKHLQQSAPVSAFIWLYLASVILYRVFLAVAFSLAESPPLGVSKGAGTIAATLLAVGYDTLILYAVLGVVFVFSQISSRSQIRDRITFALLALCVFWHAVVIGAHTNLMFTMNTGFSWSMFIEFFTILSFRDFFALMQLRDYVVMLFPLILFVLVSLRLKEQKVWPRLAGGVLAFTAVTLLCGKLLGVTLPEELALSPHAYLIKDGIRHFGINQAGPRIKPGSSLFLEDDIFVESSEPGKYRSGSIQTEANVVVIVLESTATEYIFDTARYAGGKMPMPYLHALRQKSLYAANHFASNNSSPRSLFSIFSGLYESPETKFFSMEKNLRIPHLLDFLGKAGSHEAFLVTPADINWYFPKNWFKNRGFTRLIDYNALKTIPEYKAGPTTVRDEFKTVEHFVHLMRTSNGPFFGIYYSFVGHWPYPDLAGHRLIPPDSSRSRYINNLYAQDQLIAQIIRGLEDSGKMQATVVVIVGDHGEAFYQHPGNRVHSAESYNENILSPLLIYAPGFLKPQTINLPSVHADIVPTVLDALGLGYDPQKFQGESLLRAKLRRRYVFTYGNENTITAVSAEMKKMQILQTKKTCRCFDLRIDLGELTNLSCQTGSNQYRALQAFLQTQAPRLKGYNELCNQSTCQ